MKVKTFDYLSLVEDTASDSEERVAEIKSHNEGLYKIKSPPPMGDTSQQIKVADIIRILSLKNDLEQRRSENANYRRQVCETYKHASEYKEVLTEDSDETNILGGHKLIRC